MAEPIPLSARNPLERGTVTDEDVRIVIAPEGPYHFAVTVSHADGRRTHHAVEYVAINGTTVDLEAPIWFIDADVDVGVPIEAAGETAWVWP